MRAGALLQRMRSRCCCLDAAARSAVAGPRCPASPALAAVAASSVRRGRASLAFVGRARMATVSGECGEGAEQKNPCCGCRDQQTRLVAATHSAQLSSNGGRLSMFISHELHIIPVAPGLVVICAGHAVAAVAACGAAFCARCRRCCCTPGHASDRDLKTCLLSLPRHAPHTTAGLHT